MKIRNIAGLFDEQHVLGKLTQLGDPLVLIKKHIDFDLYTPVPAQAPGRDEAAKPKAGRPAFPIATMLKILFVQRLYNLSDEQTEFQINDRMSFRRFLDMPFSDAVPDCKTVWAFREKLKDTEQVETIFAAFIGQLEDKNLIAKEGKMVDATIISVPIQRNSREDNKTIKDGQIPESFTAHPATGRQKDTDARWTKKNNISYFGYKNHIKADRRNKFILTYTVTDASVHDSQPCPGLLSESDKGEPFYADSAYHSGDIEASLSALEMEGRIIAKAYRNTPLTEADHADNKLISRHRARVEHIFGFMENSMNDAMFIKVIGKARAAVVIGLSNWVFNICRYIQVIKAKKLVAVVGYVCPVMK